MTTNPSTRRRLFAMLPATAVAAAIALATTGALGNASADPLARAGASKQVRIVDFAFRPGTLTVSPGTKVEFENRGSVAHTATRRNGFDSRKIPPGGSYSVRFRRAGTFEFHCKIHPEMKGKIVVQ